jgi:uncharacterized membrane protein
MRIGPGFGLFGQLFGAIFAGLIFIVVAVVLIGLLVLVVRFLLSATRAADIYVRLHEVAKDAAVADAPVADAPRTTPTKRIPKVPPTV